MIVLFFLVIVSIAALAGFSWRIARSVETAVPPNGVFINVDGIRLHYVDRGEGTPIVLIHGLGGQLRHFTYALVDCLATDHRVIAFDRPGYGYSHSMPSNATSLRDQAALLEKAMNQLGLQKAVIVGHSMGGAVALAMALDHPEMIASLALIAPLTHHVYRAPPWLRAVAARTRVLRWVISWTVAIPFSVLYSRRTVAHVFAPDIPQDDFPTRAGGLLGLRPVSIRAVFADVIAANTDLDNMVSRYGNLTVPVHIIHGTRDSLLSHTRHSFPMKAILPSVRIELISGGHMLPITAPEQTADFIRNVY